MKYLKIFENFNDIDNIKELCNDILVEIIDDGFIICVEEMTSKIIVIEIIKYSYSFFTWQYIKSYIISLIEHLKDNYLFINGEICLSLLNHSNVSFPIKEISSDNFEIDNNIDNIMAISMDIVKK